MRNDFVITFELYQPLFLTLYCTAELDYDMSLVAFPSEKNLKT